MSLPTRNSLQALSSKPFTILGIDPGYERLGIAIVEKTPKRDSLIHSECFKTKAESPFEERLLMLGERLQEIIKTFKPDVCAIENLFVSTNQKTAMRVGEVRGMLIYVAKAHGLSIHEYTPLQVKIAVTGYGKSDKRQVGSMVYRLIEIKNKISDDNEIDAIAIALTGSASIRLPA